MAVPLRMQQHDAKLALVCKRGIGLPKS